MPVTRSHQALRSLAFIGVLSVVAISPAQTPAKPKHPTDLSKGNTLYVVPYAHLDTQWRWAYPQVIREFLANTLHDNFALIEKYPNYVFNFSGSRRYEMMKEYYPEDYKKLTAYIKAGRWFPCGSSVDENDANVPSAESLVRQVLYGNHYFKKEFGLASKEYMLPDCFGFPYALPTVLKYCGVDGFSTQKLTWGSANGIPFKVGNWIGPDGQSVVAALDPGSYGGQVTEDLSQNSSWLARIQNTGKKSGAYVDYHYYGTGDMGGAPNGKSVDWIEKSIAGTGPINVVSAPADEMFKTLTATQVAKLPTFQGELLLTQHSAGSISSQAYMKRWNRKNELLADVAEKSSVAATFLGGASYPSERIYNAWDLVLGSQMHDMLPGTSIPKAYEYCWNDETLALKQFGAITTDAVGAVSEALDTRAKGTSVVVYNPLSITREDVAEARVVGTGAFTAFGPDGKPVPTQVLSVQNGISTVAFLAKVPATGFAAFDIRKGSVSVKSSLKVSANKLENERFVVTLNAAGDIASVYDKKFKKESFKAPAGLEEVYHNPIQWPAWNMDWEDQSKPARERVGGKAKITIAENGPARVALRVERDTNGSHFVQTIRLAAGTAGERVEVENTIDWQTKERALKAAFPVTTANSKATYDIQVGAVVRGNNDPKKYEVPQHQWFDVTDPSGKYGVAILNDSKFGSDKPSDDTIRLTLLYTPGTRGGYQDEGTQDFGRHHILYGIAPHAGDWRQGGVAWAAKRLNQPLRAFVVPSHAGTVGKEFSLVSTNTTQVEVMAVKKAEDDNGIVVRLRELTGKAANGVKLKFAGKITSAYEVNGQESKIGAASLSGNTLDAKVRGYGLASYHVTLAAKGVVAKTESKPVPLPYNVDVASTDKNRANGSFEGNFSYAAEQLPSKLTVADVKFQFGPKADGAKNAVQASGQTISLPKGYSRVYVLASAIGDAKGTFKVGNAVSETTVGNWRGYIGQYDNRLWKGDIPQMAFEWPFEWAGLNPGFVKKSDVAWYTSHYHDAKAGNAYYQYSYIHKIALDVPKGATTLTLPNNPKIRVFAVSVARNTHDVATPAAPLHDTLEDRANTKPSISLATDNTSDVAPVAIKPPLYWNDSSIRYTTDGTEPNASSAAYTTPFLINKPTTIKVAILDEKGKVFATASKTLQVDDTTAPKIVGSTLSKTFGFAQVHFSEVVTKESAEVLSNYGVPAGVSVTSARLEGDGKTVELELSGATTVGELPIHVTGVKDLSPHENAVDETVTPPDTKAVLTVPTFAPSTTKEIASAELPIKGSDAWTLSFLCKPEIQPDPKTIIAGFGRSVDGRQGTGRYICWFEQGIQFWAANCDVPSSVPLEIGKWQLLTATYDGTTLTLFKDGHAIASDRITLDDDQARAWIMPKDAWERTRTFRGEIKDFTVWNQALSAKAVAQLAAGK